MEAVAWGMWSAGPSQLLGHKIVWQVTSSLRCRLILHRHLWCPFWMSGTTTPSYVFSSGACLELTSVIMTLQSYLLFDIFFVIWYFLCHLVFSLSFYIFSVFYILVKFLMVFRSELQGKFIRSELCIHSVLLIFSLLFYHILAGLYGCLICTKLLSS